MIRDEGILIKYQGLVVFIHNFFFSINSSASAPVSCTKMPYCTNTTVLYLRHIWICLYLEKSVQLYVNLDYSSNLHGTSNTKQNILTQSITSYSYFQMSQAKNFRSISGNTHFKNVWANHRHEYPLFVKSNFIY